MTELVPLSTSPHQYQPQFSTIDERQNQQYQPQNSKYQAWASETSRAELQPRSNTEETAANSCKKHLNTKLLTSILVGLVICGIPLAVVSSLYVQKKNSPATGSNSGSSNSGGSSVNLPSQCSAYITNSDPTRLITFVSCTNCLYDTSAYFSVNWYRFTGDGGTRLATTPPSTGSCGASYPAWYNGSFPTTAGSTISSTVCVHISNILCNPSYPISISITNCNGYYVFYLPSATTSGIRYCTI